MHFHAFLFINCHLVFSFNLCHALLVNLVLDLPFSSLYECKIEFPVISGHFVQFIDSI